MRVISHPFPNFRISPVGGPQLNKALKRPATYSVYIVTEGLGGASR